MKRSELLPVSGSDLRDLSRQRLADYLTTTAGDQEVPETYEAWNERLCALGFMVEREDGQPACTIAGLIDKEDPVRLSAAPPVAPCRYPLDVL